MSTPKAQRRRTVRGGSDRTRGRSRAGRSFWRGPLPFVVAGLVIVAAVGWSVLSSQGQGAAIPSGSPAAEAVAGVTSVPADVLDRVGSGGVPDPLKQTSLPPLTGTGGKPVVVYVGAEYCPYCASERWSLIIALSRFGTFSGLSLSRSSSTDVFPDTPTFTFRGATYQSDVIELSAVETGDRTGKRIDTPTALQSGSFSRSDPQGSIPFVSIADRFVGVGSGFPPDVLRGKTWAEISTQLRDPSSATAKAVLGNANRITAAICKVTNGAPASVCSSASVKGL